MQNLVILLLVLNATLAWSQPTITEDASVDAAQTITVDDLRRRLTYFASDEMEGRELGTEANHRAARYLADELQKMGIQPYAPGKGYFQSIPFYGTDWTDLYLEVDGTSYQNLVDYYSFIRLNSPLPRLEDNEVVFLGYGIEDPKYSDYKKAHVKDKVIVILSGEPVDAQGNSRITGTKEQSAWSKAILRKLTLAKNKGVKAVLIVDEAITKDIADNSRQLRSNALKMGEPENPDLNSEYANHLYISPAIFEKLIGNQSAQVAKARKRIDDAGKFKPVALKTKITLAQNFAEKEYPFENVLGYIEGSDPKLKDELVIVSAHFDHIGRNGDVIFNGADDNGSGSCTVLEIAEAFHAAQLAGHGPRRSVLCLWVTGEEKGLLGSRYYTEHPVFPLENTVADVNIDMVGRVDAKYKDNPDYIYVIGSDRLSTALHQINEDANAKYTQLTLDYTYNADDDPNRFYYRSDHYNFARKGIPAIFFFNGTHPDYHRPGDTVDKINFVKMQKVATLIFHTAWELANRDQRIQVDVQGRN
ncbi:MAG: M28 family peptidase [Lewinellaceae bacterium]|nr:M28 family peptidase [Lewinellaceae bacterium]HPQ97969.1 M28 family peptidase [Saprospiraceae bacterium]